MACRRAETATLAFAKTAPRRNLIADCNRISHYSSWSRMSSVGQSRFLRRDEIGRRFYSSEVNNANIAVLGGGLTGLTTAYYLAKQLPPTAKITIHEKSNRLGGWIWTDKVQVDVGGKKGTVSFERGPRSLTSLSGNNWRFDDLVMYDLSFDLGLAFTLVPNKPRYIYYPDHIVPLPPAAGFFTLLKEPLFTECFLGGIGVLLNGFRRKPLPEEDQSVAEWLKELSFGTKLGDNLASAMVHGIYGGDIERLSARSVLDRLYWGQYLANTGAHERPLPVPERRILDTLGNDRYIQQIASVPKSALMHFGSGGLQTLTDAMARALEEQSNVEIKLGSNIDMMTYDTDKKIIKVSSSSSNETNTYDKVISTLSGQDTSCITNWEVETLSESESVSIMTVNIWYPQEHLNPPGFGYLIPRAVPKENNPECALGVFFDSDVEARHPDEPAGTKLFVLMGGHYYDGIDPPSEEEAIEQAKAVLERHLNIPRDTPCHAVANFAKECIPQHYVGHHKRMAQAHKELLANFDGRLAVAGGSYGRIGIMGSLRAGYDIATDTAQQGLDCTGLQWADQTGKFLMTPMSEIQKVRGVKPSSFPGVGKKGEEEKN